MNVNPLVSKIALPYARALYDHSIKQNTLHQVTADCNNLERFLETTPDFLSYLKNPLISNNEKQKKLNSVLKFQVNSDTFNFLGILVKRNRINLLDSILHQYLEIVYKTALVKIVEIQSAFPFTNRQKNKLIAKLKKLTNAREVRVSIIVDSTLIGGFLIKTRSKRIDFTIKNKLQQLSKHLDNVLDI